MTPTDIATLAASGESERLEFKSTTGERREAAKTACAMLNHQGGIIVFGITPDRRVAGQQVGEETIDDICKEFQEIEPSVIPSIERVPIGNGREVLLVRVNRGDMAPYRFRGESYKRVGSTDRRLTHDDEHHIFWNECMANSAGKTRSWKTGHWKAWTYLNFNAVPTKPYE